MPNWTKFDRFEATLSGEQPDRTPVAAWGHFIPYELHPKSLATITEQFTKTYDWDWIKLNPRSTYYGEAWGAHYDHSDIENFHSRIIDSYVTKPIHVWRIHHQPAIHSKVFLDQILTVSLLHAAVPEIPIAQTVFNPLTTLLQIAGQPIGTEEVLKGSTSDATLGRLLREEPEGVRHALDEITAAFSQYFVQLKQAGVSAIFLANTPATNSRSLNREYIIDFSDKWDRSLIAIAKDIGLKTIYHTCGPDSDPYRRLKLGAHAISWDSHSQWNPGIADNPNIIPVGGVNCNAINSHDIKTVRAQSFSTEYSLQGRPHFLAPSCAITTEFDNPALSALREGVNSVIPSAA